MFRCMQWMGPLPCDEDASGDHETCQYQRVYLPVNQVKAIMRLRVCNRPLKVHGNTARARGDEYRYHRGVSCGVCCLLTFGLAVGSSLNRMSIHGGSLPAVCLIPVKRHRAAICVLALGFTQQTPLRRSNSHSVRVNLASREHPHMFDLYQNGQSGPLALLWCSAVSDLTALSCLFGDSRAVAITDFVR